MEGEVEVEEMEEEEGGAGERAGGAEPGGKGGKAAAMRQKGQSAGRGMVGGGEEGEGEIMEWDVQGR